MYECMHISMYVSLIVCSTSSGYARCVAEKILVCVNVCRYVCMYVRLVVAMHGVLLRRYWYV